MKKIVQLSSIVAIAFLMVECEENDSSEENSFVPHDVLAHYTFENTTEDVVGSFDPSKEDVIDVSFVESHSDSSGTAASFNGHTSLVEIPNGDQFISHNNFSIAFWL